MATLIISSNEKRSPNIIVLLRPVPVGLRESYIARHVASE